MEPVTFRVAEPAGMVHAANWMYGERIGNTACGYGFSASVKQRSTSDGRLIVRRILYGADPCDMVVLNGREDVTCMTCLVRACKET